DECDAHGPVQVGEAAITGAGSLPARFVIHAASMALGGRTTRTALRSSMVHSFRLAQQNEVMTIAVPAVGTGIAGFPLDECARVMAESLRGSLSDGWTARESASCSSAMTQDGHVSRRSGTFLMVINRHPADFGLSWVVLP